ncbi:MAG: transcription antitermination factor NusB [Bryobacterales bacterium]|nr:transcription antitermination factor NusB [Bryobacterales bacterium]
MPSRHRSRQRALQILYQLDVRKLPVRDAVDNYYETLYSWESEHESGAGDAPREDDPFMEELVRGTVGHAARIDEQISSHSANWRIERMPAVDRNILRLAVYEIMERSTPPAVVIDEALELARRFAGEESIPFINGVLDSVRRQLAP